MVLSLFRFSWRFQAATLRKRVESLAHLPGDACLPGLDEQVSLVRPIGKIRSCQMESCTFRSRPFSNAVEGCRVLGKRSCMYKKVLLPNNFRT